MATNESKYWYQQHLPELLGAILLGAIVTAIVSAVMVVSFFIKWVNETPTAAGAMLVLGALVIVFLIIVADQHRQGG